MEMKLFHPLRILQNKHNDVETPDKVQYFNYYKVAREMKVPENVLEGIEKEVKEEFPSDTLLFELHVLRALKSKSWK
ncbi:MAG: hypothetical protein A2161_06470 [Candidatus Schekmanbacteria bacterium RBG_13_48_7]|uniref:Uncharacterized protein n=1 Tax=Candidatus Schekmanbacteria bacterium RBG_13_48_7 TaxID=1817878 RepID=A0A1F7RT98_9BACT|nr:MAG: hypothetical protein A2161_06470 [Candidatus Schekmanbacteria bacterium RBG_13_48_7]